MAFSYSSKPLSSATSAMTFIIPTMKAVWNDPEIEVVWPRVTGEYKGSASAERYSIDGIPLNFSDKEQKWFGIKDVFKF